MAELVISEASREILRARLASPEGQQALNDLAGLIAETAFEAMPPDLRESLATEKGVAAFREAWPDIVDAFLFRRSSKPAGQVRSPKKPTRTARKRRAPGT